MSRRQLPPKPRFYLGSILDEALGQGDLRQAQLDYLRRISPDTLEIPVSWQ